MGMVTLAGPLGDHDIRCVVLGREVATAHSITLTPDEEARAAFYAASTGLTFETGRWYGADEDGRAGVLDRWVAQEVMASFGRHGPEVMLRRMAMIRSRAQARFLARDGVAADVRSDTRAERVEVASHKTLHEGFYVARGFDLRHPTFGNGMSDTVRREVFVATDAAIVLPYDPVRDRVLLVEQFRMGPFGRGDPMPWVLEPIAGRIDGGETPEQAARREAREEAGLTLGRIEPIAAYYCSPGSSTEYFHVFLGVCDLPDGVGGLGGLEIEHEDIRLHVLAFQDAMSLLETGEADNGPLVLSLLWLVRERERLRAIG